jgi:tetratricopeptide (TPR) repeat protein
MRILYGPTSDSVAASLSPLPHDLRVFTDSSLPLAEILAAQGDWQPDLVVFHSPEYYLLPPGLVTCQVPLVFIVGDWNLALGRILPCLRMADAIVTDRYGVEVLRRHGFANVAYWPAFTFDPAVHKVRPDEPVHYDVSFVGSFNHAVHAERARWLARVAMLSDRYRIALLTDVTGDDYGRVLSQSRVVFNYSVRREMNMRAYETAAAGRVLLMEADNLEVRDFLPEGEACLLYDETNLESLIEGILADPDRQARMGAEARARIEAQTYLDQWRRLVGTLAGMAFGSPEDRPWHRLAEAQQAVALSRQALQTLSSQGAQTAVWWAERATRLAPADPHAQLNFAVVLAVVYKHTGSPEDSGFLFKECTGQFNGLLQAHPAYAQAWYAFGCLMGELGLADRAEHAWFQALAALDGAEPFSLLDPLYPLSYDRPLVLWERAVAANDEAAGKHCLRGMLAERIALQAMTSRPDDVQPILESALAGQPDNAELWRLLGETYRLQGDRRVQDAWQTSLQLLPFQFELRQQLLTLHLNLGHWEEAGALLAETQRLLAAMPVYQETWAAVFATLGRSRDDVHRDWLLSVSEAEPGWLAVVEGYWRAFPPGQPVTLHLLVGPAAGECEKVMALLEDSLQHWGFSADEVAEVSVTADPAEVPYSAQAVTCVGDAEACGSWLRRQAALD